MATKTIYFTTFENARAWAKERGLIAKDVPFVNTGNGEEPGFRFENPETLQNEFWAVVRARKFWIRDRQAGNRIEWFETREEAQQHLEAYEASDRDSGTFEPDFYEIEEDAETDYEDR
jgi:hypothetical protein